MNHHPSRFRSRMVTAFVVPVLAQEVTVTVEYDKCFLDCHFRAKIYKELGGSEDVARQRFAWCMRQRCGGM